MLWFRNAMTRELDGESTTYVGSCGQHRATQCKGNEKSQSRYESGPPRPLIGGNHLLPAFEYLN